MASHLPIGSARQEPRGLTKGGRSKKGEAGTSVRLRKLRGRSTTLIANGPPIIGGPFVFWSRSDLVASSSGPPTTSRRSSAHRSDPGVKVTPAKLTGTPSLARAGLGRRPGAGGQRFHPERGGADLGHVAHAAVHHHAAPAVGRRQRREPPAEQRAAARAAAIHHQHPAPPVALQDLRGPARCPRTPARSRSARRSRRGRRSLGTAAPRPRPGRRTGRRGRRWGSCHRFVGPGAARPACGAARAAKVQTSATSASSSSTACAARVSTVG